MATTNPSTATNAERYALLSQPQLEAILSNLYSIDVVLQNRESTLFDELVSLRNTNGQASEHARVLAEYERVVNSVADIENETAVAVKEMWTRIVAGTWDVMAGSSMEIYDRMMAEGA